MKKAQIVIMGADCPTGLTTARALRHLPVEIIGVAQNADAPCARSRRWHRLIEIAASPEKQLDLLIRGVGSELFAKRPLLLFSQDSQVIAAIDRFDMLKRDFVVPLPEADRVRTMMDKTLFHRWALAHGICVPSSVIVSSDEEALHEASGLDYPLIFKPLVRTAAWDSRVRREKFFTLQHPADLVEIIEQKKPFEMSERFLLQEWIPGDDQDVYFVLFAIAEDGRILSEVPGRKIWQWPPLTGSTAVCRLWHDSEMLETARHMATALGMFGLCSIEFKKDPRSGRLLAIEPTVGRNDYQSGVADLLDWSPTAALAAAYFDFDGPPVHSRSQVHDGVWIDELSAYRHARAGGARRTLPVLLKNLRSARRAHFMMFDILEPSLLFRHLRSRS